MPNLDRNPTHIHTLHSVYGDLATNTNVYGRYHKLPLVLIFCVAKIQPKSLLQEFKPADINPLYYSVNCNYWASQCISVYSKSTFEDNDNDTSESSMDPLTAISSFFTQQQPCIAFHDHSGDSTIQQLYSPAKDITEKVIGNKQTASDVILSICDANKKYWEQLQEKLDKPTLNINSLKRTSERAMEYSNRVKRQLSPPKQ